MADPLQDPPPTSTPSPQPPPPPELPEGTIHLKVKVPHGNLGPSVSASTFSLGAVALTSRIGDVRRQIQQTIPTNPIPSKQRLLYSGRSIYDDAETIQDALYTRRNPEQKEYVIHLIVRQEPGADGRTASPTPAAQTQGPSAAQIHQAAMQQHQQLHQRLHQQNLAQAQQPPFPAFGLPGMPVVPMQGQMGMAIPPRARRELPLDRLGMQQANFVNGQPAAGPMPPGATNDGSASVPPLSAPSETQDSVNQPPQGQLPPRPQTQPPQAAQHQHHPHRMNGNIRVEGRGPNGEVWEYEQHTVHLPPGQHPGQAGAFMMANNAPHQQGQPGMQQRQPGFPPQFAVGGWPMPGVTTYPGIPQINIPGMQMPQMGLPGQGQWPQQRMPGLAANAPAARAAGGPTALEGARSNMAELRRMLDELRNVTPQDGQPQDADRERRRVQLIEQMGQRIRDVAGYIDPLGGGARANAPNAGDSNTTPTAARSNIPAANGATGGNPSGQPSGRFRFESLNAPSLPVRPTNSQDVSAYLLSSPNGPQAIIYSPQHGAYESVPQPIPTRTQQPPTAQPQQQQPDHPPRDPAAREAAHNFIQDLAAQRMAGAQALAAGQNPMAQDALQPLLGHFWLLFRILIFAYFLLGSDMGYAKMFMLAGIGIAFWAVRLGVFGNQEVMERARRWWEGVMGLPERPRAPPGAPNAPQQVPGQPQQQGQQQAQPANAPAQAGGVQMPPDQQRPANRMPTPGEVAQRLLNENNAQNRGWLREQIRPLERAVALFVASLWPGIGEAHVRAQREVREAEERRAAEAEVESRRRAQEEAGGEKEKEEASGEAGMDGQVSGTEGSQRRAGAEPSA